MFTFYHKYVTNIIEETCMYLLTIRDLDVNRYLLTFPFPIPPSYNQQTLAEAFHLGHERFSSEQTAKRHAKDNPVNIS
jgi:hypothetical protein